MAATWTTGSCASSPTARPRRASWRCASTCGAFATARATSTTSSVTSKTCSWRRRPRPRRRAAGLPRYGAGFSYGARLWLEALRLETPPTCAGALLLAPATRVPRTPRDFGDLLLGRPIREAALDGRVLERLAKLPVPTRILVGERDEVAPPHEVSRHAGPLATVTVLAGLNHFFSRATGGGSPATDVLAPALDAAWGALVRD